jgi:hypothetical protein
MTALWKFSIKRSLIAAVTSFLITPLLVYGALLLMRPPRTDLPQQRLFQGIVYQRVARSKPRPIVLHIATIDLTAPGIKLLVTPGKATISGMDSKAKTTGDFLKEFQLQLAVNANFFLPFHERGPWDYYPHKGDPVNVLGLAMSNGKLYSGAAKIWSVLCISAKNQVQIRSVTCPRGTIGAVAGNRILIDRGLPAPLDPNVKDRPLPCTAVATNEQGNKLWIVAVDGRQPYYSEGVTLGELREILLQLGVYTALNLDGGGSTTLVAAIDSKPKVLNSPIHTRIPTRQRPVANHLGIYALPVKGS